MGAEVGEVDGGAVGAEVGAVEGGRVGDTVGDAVGGAVGGSANLMYEDQFSFGEQVTTALDR